MPLGSGSLRYEVGSLCTDYAQFSFLLTFFSALNPLTRLKEISHIFREMKVLYVALIEFIFTDLMYITTGFARLILPF